MQFTEAKFGRIFVLRLHDGDHLPNVLESFAIEKNLSTALCFFLGGAKERSRVIVGPKDCHALPPEPMVTLLNGVHEVFGVGTIFVNEKGKPKLHMHASFGRRQKTVSGCVRMGVDIWQIGEVVIIEFTGTQARRVMNKKISFELLEVQS
jgi:predicted DNA-binding protein with PD1-like motif